MEHIETERRFLIKMPAEELLSELGGDEIEQIYLESEEGQTERVRRREGHGRVTMTHTVKRRIGDISAVEEEHIITAAEFSALREKIESGTRPVLKTRYVLPYRGHDFEIDVYSEWRGVAVMEVELADEDEEFDIPPAIEVVKEVSGDRSLSNHSLSRRMPEEEEITRVI